MMTKTEREAIEKYGAETCRYAYELSLNDEKRETIAAECALYSVRQATSAIRAGRALAAQTLLARIS